MTERAATAVVLLAHGSRSDESNRFVARICRELGDRVGQPVSPAFLEMASPTLAEATATAVAAGARRVVVLPYFLAPGRHVTEDVPALVAAERDRHPAVEFVVTTMFGASGAALDALGNLVEGLELHD